MINNGKKYLKERELGNIFEEGIGEAQPLGTFEKTLIVLLGIGILVGSFYAYVNGFIVK